MKNNQKEELGMKRKTTVLIAAAALSAAVLSSLAFGGTNSESSPRRSKGALVTLGKTALGKVLVDARGRTLYRFQKDKRSRSACYGACAAYWPPLVSVARPRAAGGVRAALLRSSKRTDGKRQVTYAGHPLYRFIGDTKAGQTTGEGLTDFGAAWHVVAASGRALMRSPSDSAGTAGGYGGYGTGR
jgi:predicted lipoprotein with Yx(FWY)xxD motif